jgi:hypothetical protein
MCCATLNTKLALVKVLDKLIKKHPSASTNPDTQLGSKIFGEGVWGLIAGIKSRKASFNESGNPLFKTAFKDTTLFTPSFVKCCLSFIIKKVCLNN